MKGERGMPSPDVDAFRRRVFPESTVDDWNDWRWQLRNRIRDLEGLQRCLAVSPDEIGALEDKSGTVPVGVTPYYASLICDGGPDDPLRKTVFPSPREFDRFPGELDDPLGEESHTPVPGIVHTYPDKVLFLVTDFCATYCRYCTRSRMVGAGTSLPERSMWERALDYIKDRPAIRDVLLSGGDPLVLADERLAWLLERLRKIPHVEIIRLGTKLPAVLPQRITEDLCKTLRAAHPFWMSLHFTHPRELTPECETACARLVDAGIPLMSQTVLLRGVNDTPEVMRELMTGLLRLRVKPYYLHQCDPVKGASHFKTTVETGLEILRSLHGHTTGYAVPMYMIDAPGGGGKIPLGPDYVVDRKDGDLFLRSYNGRLYRYPESSVESVCEGADS